MDPTPVALSSGLFSVLVLVDSLVAFGMLSPCYLKPRSSVLVLFLVSTFFFFFLKEECWHSSIHVKGIYLVVPTAAAMYKSTYLHNSRSCFPSEIQNNAALSIFTWMSYKHLKFHVRETKHLHFLPKSTTTLVFPTPISDKSKMYFCIWKCEFFEPQAHTCIYTHQNFSRITPKCLECF